MGKYTPLGDFLRDQRSAEVPLSFAEVEAITGAALPPKARNQSAWWSNNASNNVMAKVWLEAGFRSERVDLARRRLVFRRAEPENAPKAWKPGDPIPLVNGRHPAYGALKDITRLVPSVDLTEPACPEWAEIADSKTFP